MTHTPGPWRVIRKVGWTIYPEKKGATYIAFMNEAREESGDNARLIGVAPEMLDGLEWVLNLHHGVSRGGGKPSDAEWETCLGEIKQLIAKAKREKGK